MDKGNRMSEENGSESGESVDIEAIMEEIRMQIRDRRHASMEDDSQIFDGPLPPEFYEALRKAGEANAQLQPKMVITESTFPLIWPVVQRVRRRFHELVLFYVNQLASKQIQFNSHLIRALSLLAEDVAESQTEES